MPFLGNSNICLFSLKLLQEIYFVQIDILRNSITIHNIDPIIVVSDQLSSSTYDSSCPDTEQLCCITDTEY